jgi:hypothetical protein
MSFLLSFGSIAPNRMQIRVRFCVGVGVGFRARFLYEVFRVSNLYDTPIITVCEIIIKKIFTSIGIYLWQEIVFLGKCPSGQMSSGQMSFWANVFLVKCPSGQMSSGQMSSGQMSFWANVFLGKCLSGQISLWANVFLGKRRMGKCRMGKCHGTDHIYNTEYRIL